MEKATPQLEVTGDNTKLLLNINGALETPSRDEFFTNYPLFKYWRNTSNDKMLEAEGINIYIHIPFCIQICDYCFYAKELIKSKDQVDDYIDNLCKEMEIVSSQFSLSKRNVNAIYIGGGTPSVLTEKQFGKMMNALHKFHSVKNPEFTFEAEPGTFSAAKLDWYKSGGVNRISMGVQSFDNEVLKLSSRKHTVDQAINSIDMIRSKGGFAMNVDLLSGLAGETMETWGKTLDIALQQKVDMITIYKMKAYTNTNVFKDVQKKELELPSEEQETEFMKVALKGVFGAGYKRWTTFAFTCNDHPHAYVENTWRGQDIIAYGVSSYGKIGNFNYQNLNGMNFYNDRIKEGKMPVSRSHQLSYKDVIVKELLLCSARLASYRKKEFITRYGFDYFNLIPDVIRELIDKGFITEDTSELNLTDKGVLFGDFVGRILASSVKNALGKDSLGFTY